MFLFEMIYYALFVILNAFFAAPAVFYILVFEEGIDFRFAVVRIEFCGLDKDTYVGHIECTLFCQFNGVTKLFLGS